MYHQKGGSVMAKGCFRRTDRVCALCRHWNGAMGSTTIQPVLGGRFQVEMKEKENELDSRIKKTTLWGNYINIASAVWGAVGFILGVLTKDRLANLWEWLSAMF